LKIIKSSNATDSEKLAGSLSLMLESSDDEAPEEVTFEDSKTQALRNMKRALDTVKREKQLLKEKRRKRQELFQEQKVCGCCGKTCAPGNYTVTTLKDRASVSYQQQAAMDFIQSRLYGPGSCRSTSNELLSLQSKKGKKKSAAVQFVKKGWGKSGRTSYGCFKILLTPSGSYRPTTSFESY
uniref:Nucleolar protein 7 n=1 Tax=Mastacembelus armatus TaxID=205130 RepID=A0A7N8XJY9_9TELE